MEFVLEEYDSDSAGDDLKPQKSNTDLNLSAEVLQLMKGFVLQWFSHHLLESVSDFDLTVGWKMLIMQLIVIMITVGTAQCWMKMKM